MDFVFSLYESEDENIVIDSQYICRCEWKTEMKNLIKDLRDQGHRLSFIEIWL